MTDAPRPGTTKAPPTPTVDGVIRSVSPHSKQSPNGKQKANSSNNTSANSPSSDSGKTAEVNAVQANPTDKSSKGKKKGKGKSKSDAPKPESKSLTEDGSQRKPKFAFLICEGDHYTKDCPRRSEISQLLKGSKGTPAVLKEPFPSQQTQMVEQGSSSAPFGSQVFMMNGVAPVSISTRLKDYARSCQAAGKEVIDGPPPPPASDPLEI